MDASGGQPLGNEKQCGEEQIEHPKGPFESIQQRGASGFADCGIRSVLTASQNLGNLGVLEGHRKIEAK